jgi:hypothetical protein
MPRVVYKIKTENKISIFFTLLYVIKWSSRNVLHINGQAVQLYVQKKEKEIKKKQFSSMCKKILSSILKLQVQSLFHLTYF